MINEQRKVLTGEMLRWQESLINLAQTVLERYEAGVLEDGVIAAECAMLQGQEPVWYRSVPVEVPEPEAEVGGDEPDIPADIPAPAQGDETADAELPPVTPSALAQMPGVIEVESTADGVAAESADAEPSPVFHIPQEVRSETMLPEPADPEETAPEQAGLCPACGAAPRAGARFCTGCGFKLPVNDHPVSPPAPLPTVIVVYCTECGLGLPERFEICPGCKKPTGF